MDQVTTVDRAPYKLTDVVLAASATAYYPSSSGFDRLATTFLAEYVRALVWASHSGTLSLEESDDRSTWSTTGSAVTVSASDWNERVWVQLTKRYWRWKYVNDATLQTGFRLYEDKTADKALVQATTTGNVAHDGADSGNPVKTGGYASNDPPTAVSAAADRVNDWRDLHGRTMARLPAEWSATQDSAANTLQTLTKAAEASKKHYVTGFDVGISGAAAGATITITLKDGTTAKWKTVIGNAAAVGTRVLLGFTGGLEMTTNTAVNLEVAAGGASVVSHANISGFTASA